MPGLQWQKYSLCCWVFRTGMHIVFRRKKHNNLSAWNVQPTWFCSSIFATLCHGLNCLTQMFVALPWHLFTSPPHSAQDMLCIECIAGAKNTILFCIASIARRERAQLCFARWANQILKEDGSRSQLWLCASAPRVQGAALKIFVQSCRRLHCFAQICNLDKIARRLHWRRCGHYLGGWSASETFSSCLG